ncbi:MAG: thiolase family protein [Chloroflexota bacterium]|nr:MAG: thiolase family protein [Chloroflexota bacterium]
MREVVIVSACRTAVGRHAGVLRDVAPGDLAVHVLKEAVRRARIHPGVVEDVIMGCTLPAGRASNVGRWALVKAGFPVHVPGQTVNRLCSSGLQAIVTAAQVILNEDAEIVIASGLESMSRAPFLLEKMPNPYQRGPQLLLDSFGGPFSSPPEIYGEMVMGDTAENVAEKFNISREEQDAFALESQKRAIAAIRAGRFKDEIVPVEIPQKMGPAVVVDTDEHPRPETTLEGLARLAPAFRTGGSVTAGNSSGMNDGAAAMVMMSKEKAKDLGIKPLVTYRAYSVAGVDPRVMGIGPVSAVPKVLKKVGLTADDMDVIELNEAFASQAVYCIKELGLDPAKVNPNGGAIALGHPLGCTGIRLTTTMIYELLRRQGRYGMVTMCVGGGQGMAAIFEREEY